MLKLTAIGNLGKDAIINQVNGKQVINFSIAHTEKYKDKDGNQQEKTQWIEAAYWSDSKVGAYLKKGTSVYIEGTPEVRTYPKTDGSTGTSLTVRVGMVQLLGGKQEGQQQADPMQQANESHKPKIVPAGNESEELPF